MAGTAPAFREAHRSPVGRRAGQALPGRPRPVVPRRSVARRLPRHRGAGWPDRARQPAAPGSRRAGRHHRRRRRCAAPPRGRGGPGRRRPGGAPDRPPQRLLELPRYRAMEQSFDRIGPHGRSAMCSTAAVQVCVDAGERSRRRRALGRPARARPGAARGVRELPAPARAAHRLEVHALGGVDAGRSRPHRAARRPGPRRPGRGLGASRAGRPGAVRAGRRRLAGARGAHVRRLGARRASPARPPSTTSTTTCPRCSPRCAPAATWKCATSTCSRAGGGRCPLAVLTALLSDPGVIDVVRNVCAPARTRWVAGRPPRAGRPRARPSGRPGVRPGGGPSTRSRRPAWLTDELDAMTERLVRHGLCPADEPEGASL